MAVDKSNWDPKKCQAESKKRPGDQCRNYPVRGLRVCLRHGGGSKKARAAATRNLEQEKLTRVARRLGTPHDNLDPAQALLDLVASKAGEVEWLRHQVELLEIDGDLWWGKTKDSKATARWATRQRSPRKPGSTSSTRCCTKHRTSSPGTPPKR